MIDRKEIDLLIRAQLKGKQDLTGITKSITELEKAIESQAAAAKRGESSIDELKATLLSLKQVQDQLKGQADLVGTFQRQGDAIAKTEERVHKATKAYEEYRAKLDALSEVTDRQQDRLIKLSSAQERAQAGLDKQRDRYVKLAEALREAGIATDNLGQAEMRVRDSAAQIGVAINKAQQAIGTYADDVRRSRDELRQREAAEQDSIRTIRQFTEAEERAAAASKRRAQDHAEVAQIIADRNARTTADGNQFAEQAREAARARELIALREDIIKRSEQQIKLDKELAKNSALVKTADDAQEAARAYTTLARATDDLRPKTTSLTAEIDRIINPSKAAQKSLSGVEKEVQTLAAKITMMSGPVKGYREQMTALADAGRNIGSQANLIDTFQRQTVALRASRAEFSAARAEVTRYAAEVRKGGEAGQQAATRLAEAGNRSRTAAKALADQLVATRASREALRQAGIATNDLTAAQQRLTNAARATTTATRTLTEAKRKYGEAVERTNRSLRLFGDGGRTTLSLMQRIRGEVLALAAGYVGLYGAINQAQLSIDAAANREAIRNQLSISVGTDKAAIDQEYAYIKAQADRIGIEFEEVARGYAKFAASAKMAGRSREEIRYIWEAFAEVGRVANLTTDDLGGIFKALEQMFSKGKIMAEELRLQMGDRVPGAFQVFAQALQDTFPDFNKAMEQGLITSDHVVTAAKRYREIVADQLPEAMQSLRAEQARLNTAVFEFQLAVADSGWADTYKEMLPIITDFLRSDEGVEFAKKLSAAFESVANGLVWIMENIDTVMAGAKVLGTYFLVMITVSMIKRVWDMGVAIRALAGVMGTATGALRTNMKAWPTWAKGVAGALGVVAAALFGFAIGTWAYEEFEVVRKAGIALVTGLDIVWTRIKYGAMMLFEEIPRLGKNAFSLLLNTFTWGVRNLLALYSGALRAMGQQGEADTVDKVIDGMTAKYEVQGDRIAELRAEMERDIEAIKRIGDEMWKDAANPPSSGGPKPNRPARTNVTTPFPNTNPAGKNTGPSEADIAKREREIEQITRALEQIETRIERAQTETLSAQLNAVDIEYAKLTRRIAALGGQAGAEFMARLNQAAGELKTQITRKFNEQLLDEQMGLQNKMEDIEAAAGKREKFSLDARLAAVRTRYEDTYRAIEDFRQKLAMNDHDTTAADLMRQRLDAGIVQLQNVERVKFATEELSRRESYINDLINLRAQRISTINAQREIGAISDVEAAERINQINKEATPSIQAAAMAAKEWALAHQAIFANPEQMNAFVAKMDEIAVKASAVVKEFDDFTKLIGESGWAAIDNTLGSAADAFEGLVSKQKDAKEAFRDLASEAAGFFRDLFRDLVLAQARMAILNMFRSSSTPWIQAIAAAGGASVGVMHSGGVVGAGMNRRRTVSPDLFANAPRYHSGGLAGLGSNEYAAILKKNEEVLTEGSPRNILNGGLRPSSSGEQSNRPMRFIFVDDERKVGDYLRGAESDEVFVEKLRRHSSVIRSLGGRG